MVVVTAKKIAIICGSIGTWVSFLGLMLGIATNHWTYAGIEFVILLLNYYGVKAVKKYMN